MEKAKSKRFVQKVSVLWNFLSMYFPRRKQRDDAACAAYREERDRDELNGLFIRVPFDCKALFYV